jgi:hypothetical protein
MIPPAKRGGRNPGPERLHWRAKQTERATQHTHRWTLARRSATERATTNPYGITLNRAWTEWAAQHGVSETIAAALYLVSRNRKADKVVVKLLPGEMERVIAFVQRWPDHYPPGALAALKNSRPTTPAEASTPSDATERPPAQYSTGGGGNCRKRTAVAGRFRCPHLPADGGNREAD